MPGFSEPTVAVAHSLAGRLIERARVQPDSVALVTDAGRVTYAELHALACAARTRVEAVAPAGAPVAVRAAKTPGTIALIVACLLARRPFLLPSPELGEQALDALLERAGCRALLDGSTCRLTPGAHGTVPGDVRFMLTTSGSTGVPKIVPLTAGAVDRFTDWAAGRFGLRPGTVVLNYAPLNFDLCLLDVWATLKAGGTVVLADPERSTDGRYLAGLITAERVQVVQSVPMFYRLVADARGGEPLPGVQHVIVTGDRITAGLLGELPALFPAARLYNLYGCTETNDSFLHELREPAGDGTAVPIGRPIAGVDALVAGDDGAVLDGPATGELLVRTPFQTTGYLGPNHAFVRLDGGRPYFRSGDLVRRDEHGVFTLIGRNDFQVKVRGTRVNLQEVEHLLLAHEAAAEAAVVGVPDDLSGVRIHAVVRRKGPLNTLALRDYCRTRLPRAAIPATFQVVDEPLPMTSTGKVDRQSIINTLRNRS
ncbi:MAG TPA: AMP-binding protein [Nonomuraea sp.]|nr:AMP-binding protein [Nonomuraea sp.]